MFSGMLGPVYTFDRESFIYIFLAKKGMKIHRANLLAGISVGVLVKV